MNVAQIASSDNTVAPFRTRRPPANLTDRLLKVPCSRFQRQLRNGRLNALVLLVHCRHADRQGVEVPCRRSLMAVRAVWCGSLVACVLPGTVAWSGLKKGLSSSKKLCLPLSTGVSRRGGTAWQPWSSSRSAQLSRRLEVINEQGKAWAVAGSAPTGTVRQMLPPAGGGLSGSGGRGLQRHWPARRAAAWSPTAKRVDVPAKLSARVFSFGHGRKPTPPTRTPSPWFASHAGPGRSHGRWGAGPAAVLADRATSSPAPHRTVSRLHRLLLD